LWKGKGRRWHNPHKSKEDNAMTYRVKNEFFRSSIVRLKKIGAHCRVQTTCPKINTIKMTHSLKEICAIFK